MNELAKVIGVQSPVDEQAVEAELVEYVTGVQPAEKREPWRITSLGAADWAMAKLAEVRRIEAEYRDQVALWQDAGQRAARSADWLEERLKEWAVSERTKDRKTFPLAHGTVATRESKSKMVVVDEAQALAWALVACPDAVKTVQSILVSRLGDAARIGEVVVGFEAVDKATGEVERIMVNEVATAQDDKLAALRKAMGDGYVVEPILNLAVVGVDGLPIPGFGVEDAHVSASVTPLIL